MVKAKREEKSTERLSKSKFLKEYELGEKIETYSLCGGLAGDGKLVVSAFVKGHGEGSANVKPGSRPTSTLPTITATEETLPGGGGTNSVEGGGDIVSIHSRVEALKPCNVISPVVSIISLTAGASH